MIGERDASLATSNAELAGAEKALTEARHTARDRQTLRGWLAVPLLRVKADASEEDAGLDLRGALDNADTRVVGPSAP